MHRHITLGVDVPGMVWGAVHLGGDGDQVQLEVRAVAQLDDAGRLGERGQVEPLAARFDDDETTHSKKGGRNFLRFCMDMTTHEP